jgi:hypothetical protein
MALGRRAAPNEIVGLYDFYQRRFEHLASADLDESWIALITLEEK